MFIEFCEKLIKINQIYMVEKSFASGGFIIKIILEDGDRYFEEFESEDKRDSRWLELKRILDSK